jgi:hypothetical protein
MTGLPPGGPSPGIALMEMEASPKTLRWLLASDPAIRWQVLRDLAGAPRPEYEAERRRLLTTGWCARLLKKQGDDSLWSHSLYNGKWVSTTYSLYQLKLFGLPPRHPAATRACRILLEGGLFGGNEIRFSRNQEIRDLGVTAFVLSLCCYFGLDSRVLDEIVLLLLRKQQPTGEWLANDGPAAGEYAFEATRLVLEALHQYGRRFPNREPIAVSVAAEGGREFLLRHQLFLRGGKPIKPRWTVFPFPPYWFYDALTALDGFRRARVKRDARMLPAVDLVRRRRRPDGTWALGAPHSGKVFFTMERTGKPSRWNTLRALRVLNWWEGGL